MHRILSTAVVLFLLSRGPAGAQEATGPFDEPPHARSAVLRVLNRFIASWNRDDVASFVGLFMPEGELITSKGSSKTQEEIERVITEKHPEIFFGTDLSKQVDSIRFFGSNLAEVTGYFTLCCVPVLLGLETSTDGRFSLELIEQDGEWKIERATIRS